jgi:hypothetical protein
MMGYGLTLAGRNLLQASHKGDKENRLELSSLIQRSFLFKATYRH